MLFWNTVFNKVKQLHFSSMRESWYCFFYSIYFLKLIIPVKKDLKSSTMANTSKLILLVFSLPQYNCICFCPFDYS